jgi:hypothetical protein
MFHDTRMSHNGNVDIDNDVINTVISRERHFEDRNSVTVGQCARQVKTRTGVMTGHIGIPTKLVN